MIYLDKHDAPISNGSFVKLIFSSATIRNKVYIYKVISDTESDTESLSVKWINSGILGYEPIFDLIDCDRCELISADEALIEMFKA